MVIMSISDIASENVVAEALTYICLPPFYLARVELATRLGIIYRGIVRGPGDPASTLLSVASWAEHNNQANDAVIELAEEMSEAGCLNLDQLKVMARDAMLTTKPKGR